jgi:hypothetical protein
VCSSLVVLVCHCVYPSSTPTWRAGGSSCSPRSERSKSELSSSLSKELAEVPSHREWGYQLRISTSIGATFLVIQVEEVRTQSSHVAVRAVAKLEVLSAHARSYKAEALPRASLAMTFACSAVKPAFSAMVFALW